MKILSRACINPCTTSRAALVWCCILCYASPVANSLRLRFTPGQMAQLDVLNLVKGIQTEGDYIDFRNMLARYFADKAQKQIDALWENGKINEQTIEQWGNERMRTPYRYAVHRS